MLNHPMFSTSVIPDFEKENVIRLAIQGQKIRQVVDEIDLKKCKLEQLQLLRGVIEVAISGETEKIDNIKLSIKNTKNIKHTGELTSLDANPALLAHSQLANKAKKVEILTKNLEFCIRKIDVFLKQREKFINYLTN